MEKQYDIVLFGATGFVGRYFSKFIQEFEKTHNWKWAIAGRNREKLEKLQKDIKHPGYNGIIIADVGDQESLDKMAAQCKLLISVAGPFLKYGRPVVDACLKSQTAYMDITGEMPYLEKLIQNVHKTAVETKTPLISFIGLDSVPSDYGAFAVSEKFHKKYGTWPETIDGIFKMKGGLNGGTFQSAMEIFSQSTEEDRANPYWPLKRRDWTNNIHDHDRTKAYYDKDLNKWIAPYFMATINNRVVRRTRELLCDENELYGDHFSYNEGFDLGSKANAFSTRAVAMMLKTTDLIMTNPLGRKITHKFGPSSGQGPSVDIIENGFVKAVFKAKRGDQVEWLTMESNGDPGNKTTCRLMLSCAETYLRCLEKGVHIPGGQLTPVAAFQGELSESFKHFGIDWK